jgi:hypothetical protein
MIGQVAPFSPLSDNGNQAVNCRETFIRGEWFKNAGLLRVLPFAVFMAFVGFEEIAGFLGRYGLIHVGQSFPFVLYPIKTIATAAVLLLLRHHYSEIRLADLLKPIQSIASIVLGLLVFLVWISLDYSVGAKTPGFDTTLLKNGTAVFVVTCFRLLGAAAIVPIMEELFWRSFLNRYTISKDFDRIPVGLFTWQSFLICSVLFGLEHHLILAGVIAGATYNIVLFLTKSVSQCILSHGITNLALGVYVLSTGKWHFW